MYVDAQAALNVLAATLILANTLINVWTNRKVAAVNTKVDGLATQAVAGAKLEGIVQGAGITLPAPPPPPLSTV